MGTRSAGRARATSARPESSLSIRVRDGERSAGRRQRGGRGSLSPPPHPSERSETTLGSRSGSAPSVAAMNEIAQRKLAERRRRIATIRQRVAPAALVTFALAWGVIGFDGSTGSTSGTTATTATSTSQQASVSVAATDDSSDDETDSTDPSSSTAPTPMVTSQS